MDNNNYLGCEMKVEKGEAGYVLEDVPHLTDYIPDLPVCVFYFLFLDLFHFAYFNLTVTILLL